MSEQLVWPIGFILSMFATILGLSLGNTTEKRLIMGTSCGVTTAVLSFTILFKLAG